MARKSSTSVAVPHNKDLELAREAARGDPKVLGSIYTTNHRAVARYLKAYLGPGTDLDDLVQETFIRVCSSIRNYRGECSLATWIHGVGRNVARTAGSKVARRQRLLAAHSHTRVGENPEQQMRADETAAELYRVLESLPTIEREAFVVRVLEETPIEQASDLLGVPRSTVSDRTRRAEAKIRAALDQPGDTT